MSVFQPTAPPVDRSIRANEPAVAVPGRLVFRMTLAAFSVAALLAGCTVGPNYKAPDTSTPAQFKEAAPTSSAIGGLADQTVMINSKRAAATTASASGAATTMPATLAATTEPINLERWWYSFNDTELDKLIAESLKANYTVAIAISKVRQARDERIVIAAPIFPQLNVDGSYDRSRFSNDPKQHVKPINESYQVGLDASWEIDVFGGTRRAIEAADYNIDASVENQRDAMITLMGEVALDYIQLRGAQAQLAVTLKSLKGQQDTLSLTEDRTRAGIGADSDVANALATVESTASQVPSLEATIDVSIHALSVLLSLDPSALTDELVTAEPLPIGPLKVPPGLPSDLVRRRPDVRFAERQLGAATAGIGVAVADLFPQFSLNASVGQSNSVFKRLFDFNSRTNSIGPNVDWNVFNAGSVQANIEVNKEVAQQALLTYKQTVLTSLQEVEDALIVYEREQLRNTALSATVDANQRAYNISLELYSKGLQDFLSVLTSEQNLFGSQEALASSNTQLGTDLVALYKALGGGWEKIDDDQPVGKVPPATAPSNDTAVLPN